LAERAVVGHPSDSRTYIYAMAANRLPGAGVDSHADSGHGRRNWSRCWCGSKTHGFVGGCASSRESGSVRCHSSKTAIIAGQRIAAVHNLLVRKHNYSRYGCHSGRQARAGHLHWHHAVRVITAQAPASETILCIVTGQIDSTRYRLGPAQRNICHDTYS